MTDKSRAQTAAAEPVVGQAAEVRGWSGSCLRIDRFLLGQVGAAGAVAGTVLGDHREDRHRVDRLEPGVSAELERVAAVQLRSVLRL